MDDELNLNKDAVGQSRLNVGLAAEIRRHEANEWADMAANGLQWVRNLRDGVSTVDDAVASLELQLVHCTAVSKAANVKLRGSPASGRVPLECRVRGF